MHSDCFCACHRQGKFFAQLPGLNVEVVEHFHVIGDEADGRDYDCACEILLLDFTQMVEDIWFEPRSSREKSAPCCAALKTSPLDRVRLRKASTSAT